MFNDYRYYFLLLVLSDVSVILLLFCYDVFRDVCFKLFNVFYPVRDLFMFKDVK